ncbi:murein L,D-transpeptidase catalytic domain family protein [Legionella sp. PATHC035]|uniref:murein L,D-transpeptidase catalytic domain family protein n=1 Tax=Legionella sp. PATHC035 TaxID=2992040 RepID=UPI002242E198|nr:murein L,D-transpeptidase catalytic domain family protein [Legionella sp. PATHC035]MCW8408307.1 murein L,D-transpeptidase catalytic domain family protein [Legionella sp. PATHC035]
MGSLLLLGLAVTFTYFPQLPLAFPQAQAIVKDDVRLISETARFSVQINDQSLNDIRLMLAHEAPHLNPLVINKVLTSLKCAIEYNVDHNNILTIIDYSLPSNEKRLWVFDLSAKKLLFHTYVSHGIKSGTLLTNYFSNKFNSKASSIGVYQTQQAYYGRDGLSLRLDGLDRNFNDNASGRSVVMHSGWYVEERFIKRYGRPGRSWGCPALPLENSQAIINTIKDKSLLVVYYPSDAWFAKSKFLNCDKSPSPQYTSNPTIQVPTSAPDEHRDAIFFVGSGYKGKRTETNPVAVISADTYQRVFHTTAPLSRMLRRQINNAEYVALNAQEFNYLANHNNPNDAAQDDGIRAIRFVIPTLKVVRGGYYETQMEIVDLGKIKQVKVNGDSARENITVYFEGKPSVNLNPSDAFIRWVGL